MNAPRKQSWYAQYRSCLKLNRDGNIVEVDADRWRQLEEVRAVMGAPFPERVARLTLRKSDWSAWISHGLRLLRGNGVPCLYACDCAARALPAWEAAHPDDPGPRRAIEAARARLAGKLTAEELEKARIGAARSFDDSHSAKAAALAAHYVTRIDTSLDLRLFIVAVLRNAAEATGDPEAEMRWQADRMAAYVMGTEGAP